MTSFPPAAVAASKRNRRSIPFVLLVAAAVFLSAASVAWAVGELSQKPGKAGCISETGTDGACQVGRALDAAFNVVVSPDGRNAYAASLSSDAIAIFDRDPLTGALTQKPGNAACVSNGGVGGCEPARMLERAHDVVVSPDGRNVYATGEESDAVVVLNRDPATGALSQAPGPGGCVSQAGAGGCTPAKALAVPREIAVSPDGKNLYVVGLSQQAVVVLNRDPATGLLTQSADKAGCVSENGSQGGCEDGVALVFPIDIALSPDGRSVYVASLTSEAVAIFDRNSVSGALTQSGCVSEDGTGGACRDGVGLNVPQAVTLSPDGKSLYVAAQGVAVFDRGASGGLTQKPGTAGCITDSGSDGACENGTALIELTDLAIAPDEANVYVFDASSETVSIFDRDPSGALRQKAGPGGCVSEVGTNGACQDGVALKGDGDLTLSPDGRNLYLAGTASDSIAIFDRAVPAPSPDTLAPTLSGFRLTPKRFKPPKGRSSFRFGLSEPAAVRIEIERARPGRRVGGRCRAATPRLAAKPRCTRFVRRATLRFAGRSTGANAIRFSGRIGKRALAAGAYRATIVATDSAGNRSAPRRASFAILAKKPQRR